jgi:hypothetical protein
MQKYSQTSKQDSVQTFTSAHSTKYHMLKQESPLQGIAKTGTNINNYHKRLKVNSCLLEELKS